MTTMPNSAYRDRVLDRPVPSRIRAALILTPIIIIFELWVWVFFAAGGLRGGPSGNNWTGDFAMFYASARLLETGGNPYDQALLVRTEAAILRRQHVQTSASPRLLRVGNPPLALWVLRPLAHLPFRLAGWTWLISMYVFSAVGFLALLRYLGWKRYVVPSIIFLLSTPVFHDVGNWDGLIFAGVSVSLLLAARHQYAAGALLALAWIKPQVLPLALLVILCQTPRAQMVKGFLAATVGMFAVTIAAVGWATLDSWIKGMLGYSQWAAEPGISSLADSYIYWAPHLVQVALGAMCLAAAAALTYAWWRGAGPAGRNVFSGAWLWIVWFLATPYAHFSDEILVALPILVLMGIDGANLLRWTSISCLYILAFSMALAGTSFLWLPLALMGAVCVLDRPHGLPRPHLHPLAEPV